MKYKCEYSISYNFRPNELYGMGKESLTVQISKLLTAEEFLDILVENSKLKHESILEAIYGTTETVERQDWKNWLGQPMYHITDIKYELVDG